MLKKIYVVRHCEAQGQSSESQLTEKGLQQANYLADFFKSTKINRIISSPYLRAIQSVEPLSERTNIKIETDERLAERTLSTTDLPDWYENLKETFIDMDLKFEGGESSQEAMNRIRKVVKEAFKSENENTVIVSHGNIISLLLKDYNRNVDFEFWENLSNPDVFQLNYLNNRVELKRIWNEE